MTVQSAEEIPPNCSSRAAQPPSRHEEISAEEFLSVFFDVGPTGVAVCDLEGRFVRVNRRLTGLLGYGADELVGKHFMDVTESSDGRISLDHQRLLLDEQVGHATFEKRYRRKSGELVACQVTLALVRNREGRPHSVVALVQDLSELKKAEEERARLREELFQAQKMEAVGALAGGIVHDFNNLLGVILGFASLMRLRLKPGDPLQETIKMIEHSAERASDLTRQLLRFTRHEKSELKPLHVNEVLERVGRIVSRTFDRRIRVQTQFAGNLPWVECDAAELEQAVLNLAINARDAMPESGTLTLSSSLVRLDATDARRPAERPPGEYVRVAVRDTGIGIQPEVLPRIFDPFFTTKQPGKGSGLGLDVVRRIVSEAQGHVRVESQVGLGSEFTLYLPASKRVGEAVERPRPAKVRRGRGKVLVVDDEPLMLSFAREALKRLGYKVLAATSGNQACEIYSKRAHEIDYVLLDIVMPKMNGIETCRKLSQINPKVKVLLSSGYGVQEALEGLKPRNVPFLGKPYTLETLALALEGIQKN